MELQIRKMREKDGDEDREGGRRKKTAPQTIKVNVEKEILSDTHALRNEDEEVEEFYAIVRRMQVAVKYFEKGSNNSDHQNTNNAGGDQVRWRAALESTLPVVDADVAGEDHVVTELIADEVNNVVLDLNQAPVEEPETPT